MAETHELTPCTSSTYLSLPPACRWAMGIWSMTTGRARRMIG